MERAATPLADTPARAAAAAEARLALDFTAEGVRLYLRGAEADWHCVGEAALLGPGFTERIAALRAEAEARFLARSPAWLWLPAEQVYALDLPPGAPEAMDAEAAGARIAAEAEIAEGGAALVVALSPPDAEGRVQALAALRQTAEEAVDYAGRWGFVPGVVGTRHAADRFGASGAAFSEPAPRGRTEPAQAAVAEAPAGGAHRVGWVWGLALGTGAVAGLLWALVAGIETTPRTPNPAAAPEALRLAWAEGPPPVVAGVPPGDVGRVAPSHPRPAEAPPWPPLPTPRESSVEPTAGMTPAASPTPRADRSARPSRSDGVPSAGALPADLASASPPAAPASTRFHLGRIGGEDPPRPPPPTRPTAPGLAKAGTLPMPLAPLAPLARRDGPGLAGSAAAPPSGDTAPPLPARVVGGPRPPALGAPGSAVARAVARDAGLSPRPLRGPPPAGLAPAPARADQAPGPTGVPGLGAAEASPFPPPRPDPTVPAPADLAGIPAPPPRPTAEPRAPEVPAPAATAEPEPEAGSRRLARAVSPVFRAPPPPERPEAEARPRPSPALPPLEEVLRGPRRSVGLAARARGLPLDRTALIGILQLETGRSALVRLPDGAVRRLSRGDDVGGWRVSLIGRDAVRLERSGQSRTLLLVGR